MTKLYKQSHAFWSKNSPKHDISALHICRDQTLISGSSNGDILIWKYIEKPFPCIYVHNATNRTIIRALETYNYDDKNFLVVSSEEGYITLFDLADAHIVNQASHLQNILTIKSQVKENNSAFLFCSGPYADIKVLDAIDLTLIYKLCSKFSPDLISSFCLLHNNASNLDVIIGITITGYVKLWTLSDENELPSTNEIYENEAKGTELFNCKQITYCPDNPKIFLMVAPSILRLYNVACFIRLCEIPTPLKDESWLGGAFLNKTQLIAWTDCVRAHIYTLSFESENRYRATHVASLNLPNKQRLLEPIFTFSGTNLICANDCQIHIWDLQSSLPNISNPTISSSQSKHATIPIIYPVNTFSFDNDWANNVGCDNVSPLYENLLKITSGDSFQQTDADNTSITCCLYLPFHDYYLFGTNNGRIYILQRASLGLLENFANYTKQFSKCQHLSHSQYLPISASPYAFASRYRKSAKINEDIRRISTVLNLPQNGRRPKKVSLVDKNLSQEVSGKPFDNFQKSLTNTVITHLVYPHVQCETYDSNHLISADSHSRIYLWDLNTFCLVQTFCPHYLYSDDEGIENGVGGIRDIILLPGQKSILNVKTSNVQSFTALNQYVLSISTDNSLAILDLRTKSIIATLSTQLMSAPPINGVYWLPAKRFLVAATDGGIVFVWHIDNGLIDRCLTDTAANILLQKLLQYKIWPALPETNNSFTTPYKNIPSHDVHNNYSPIGPVKPPRSLLTLYVPKQNLTYSNGLCHNTPSHCYREKKSLVFQIAFYDLAYFTRIFGLSNSSSENDENLASIIEQPSPTQTRTGFQSLQSTPTHLSHYKTNANNIKMNGKSGHHNSLSTTLVHLSPEKQRSLLYRQASLQKESIGPIHDLNQLYYNASSPIRKRSAMIYEKKILIAILATTHPWNLNVEFDKRLGKLFDCHEPTSLPSTDSIVSSNFSFSLPLNTSASYIPSNSFLIAKTTKLIQLLIILRLLDRNCRIEHTLERLSLDENDDYDTDAGSHNVAERFKNNVDKDRSDNNRIKATKPKLDDRSNHIALCQRLKVFYLRTFLSHSFTTSNNETEGGGVVLDILFSKLLGPEPIRDACVSVLTYIFFSEDFVVSSADLSNKTQSDEYNANISSSRHKKFQDELIGYILELCIYKLELLNYHFRLYVGGKSSQTSKFSHQQNLISHKPLAFSNTPTNYNYNDNLNYDISNIRASQRNNTLHRDSRNKSKLQQFGIMPNPYAEEDDLSATSDLDSVEEVVDDTYYNNLEYLPSATGLSQPRNLQADDKAKNKRHHYTLLATLKQSITAYFGHPFQNFYTYYGCYPDAILAFMSMSFFGSKLPPDLNTNEIKTGSPYKRFSQYFSLKNPRLIILISNLITGFINSPLTTPISQPTSSIPHNAKSFAKTKFATPNNSILNFVSQTNHQPNGIKTFDFAQYFTYNDALNKMIAYEVLCQGFSTWEPFLDLTALIMRLLELCCALRQYDEENYQQKSLYEATYSCLGQIAYIRPAAFITIINKEINKNMLGTFTPFQNLNIASSQLNAAFHHHGSSGSFGHFGQQMPAARAANQSNTNSVGNANLLGKSRDFIFAIIEQQLLRNKPFEILNLLPETIDIYVYYGGNTISRSKDWESLLAPFLKFSQVVFNADKKQLVVGTSKGQLYLYDFKTIKPEICTTPHASPITCLSFSPDYKSLASFAYSEGALVAWQLTSSLFGIGSTQVKYLKSWKVVPKNKENLLKRESIPHNDVTGKVRLIWINNRVILVLFADGSEQKFYL